MFSLRLLCGILQLSMLLSSLRNTTWRAPEKKISSLIFSNVWRRGTNEPVNGHIPKPFQCRWAGRGRFFNYVAITIIGGVIACNSERLVRSVAGLIVCFIGVAGVYYFLNSPFVAMMQVLIYVGAVAVTISFAIMLAAPEEQKRIGPSGPLVGPLGFATRCSSYRRAYYPCH